MSSAYERLGVSATKEEVHAAIASSDPGIFSDAFCRLTADVLGNDPDWCCALHSDGAGTKAIIAYLVYRETGDPSVFRHIAQDSLVMNLDDLLCVGACERFILSNTIGRNRRYVPGEVVREIVAGYDDFAKSMSEYGIEIVSSGGETADLPDAVRTLVVDSSLATRMRRDRVIDNSRIAPGDVIVGFSSSGRAVHEKAANSAINSGIGSNGLTLARHALLSQHYAENYPETFAPDIDPKAAYQGKFRLADAPPGLGMTIGAALMSPTRTYAPIIRDLLSRPGFVIHGAVHNTGGGLTKCKRFGRSIAYVKDNLFDPPPIFTLIAETAGVAWREMYQTFNVGHRFELFLPRDFADEAMLAASRYGVEAKIIGRCETRADGKNHVRIESNHGSFEFAE